MSIEDVVLVSTVREDIRGHALRIDLAEIPLRVEAEQLGSLGVEIPVHLRFPKRGASSSADLKQVNAHGVDDKLSAEDGVSENMSALKGEQAGLVENSRGEVTETRIVETGKEASMINDIGIQQGGPGKDNSGVSIAVSPVTSGPGSAASPVLPSYPVGRGISLPFGQSLPKCGWCSCNGLIAWSRRSNPKENGALCLDHGLKPKSATRDLILYDKSTFRYSFISPEHEAAILAFLS